MKITDYLIVTATNTNALQSLVKENIKVWGWVPLGGIAVTVVPPSEHAELCYQCTQAMVKYACTGDAPWNRGCDMEGYAE